MFDKLFRRRTEYVDAETVQKSGNRRSLAVIVIIIVAICMLAFGGNDGKEEKKGEKSANYTSESVDFEKYSAFAEDRLKSVLSGIKGAGKVDVMLSFDAVNEKVLAKNSKKENTSDTEENKKKEAYGTEENIMIYGSGSGEQPFVLKERLPLPSGVLVLASGAGNETVRLEIYEAVKALYGIGGHRIKVAQHKDK